MFKNAIAIACAAVLFTGPAKAETPIQLTEMSGRLFEQGIETLDPILMISAAKIRKSLALEKDKATATEDQIVSWQDMLDTAIAAAPDDAQIAALVDDVRAESSKGVSTGQVYSITTLRGGGTDVYPALAYKGGDHAEDEQPRVSAPLTPAVRELAELPVGAAPAQQRDHGLHAERDHRQQARALEAQVIDGGARGAKPGPADEDEQGDDQQERRRGEPGRAQGWRPVGLDETPVDPGLGVRDARAHRANAPAFRFSMTHPVSGSKCALGIVVQF